jgi:hypothetical protein
MELDRFSLSFISFGTTLGIGTEQIPLPADVDVWTAMFVASVGPALIALFSFSVRAVASIAAAYLKKKAELKHEQAQAMLADEDQSNNAAAKTLMLEASAELAAANKAEELIENLEKKGK